MSNARHVEMVLGDVHWLLELMDERGVGVWLDGGWGVDACLGQQTREHDDVDIVVEQRHLDAAVEALRPAGFVPVPRDDTRAWNFVLGDERGRLIDFHVIVLADDGRGVYGPPRNGDAYPADSLAWTGTLGGRRVRCISPEWLVAFHTGYDADEKDWADVRALCERFDIPVPDDYRKFQTRPAGSNSPVQEQLP